MIIVTIIIMIIVMIMMTIVIMIIIAGIFLAARHLLSSSNISSCHSLSLPSKIYLFIFSRKNLFKPQHFFAGLKFTNLTFSGQNVQLFYIPKFYNWFVCRPPNTNISLSSQGTASSSFHPISDWYFQQYDPVISSHSRLASSTVWSGTPPTKMEVGPLYLKPNSLFIFTVHTSLMSSKNGMKLL